jgi:hypothetical protein
MHVQYLLNILQQRAGHHLVIDMKEGNIKYQFPLKRGMEYFPRKRMKLPFDYIIRTNYDVDASSPDVT